MTTLESEAGAFAADLSATFNSVFAVDEPASFEVTTAPWQQGATTRLVVHSVPQALVLHIAGLAALELLVTFRCRWDHQERYLAVDQSSWAVFAHGFGDPLVRYEYLSQMSGREVPVAHLHVHAHRDELLYQLVRAEKRKPRTRIRVLTGESSGALPRLSNLHLPVGGARLRPCLEDLYSFLIAEFAVDTRLGYLDVLETKRAEWRRRQIGVCVRDAPSEAVRVLRDLGYTVDDPPGGPSPEQSDKLRRY